jgi:aminopeptidase
LTELDRYARLVLEIGVGFRSGQPLSLSGRVEHAPLLRALAAAAYEQGATFVDTRYLDDTVRRAQIEHAPEEWLGVSPPYLIDEIEWFREHGGATIRTESAPAADAFAGLDEGRVARARDPELLLALMRHIEGGGQWTIAPYATVAWAERLFGEPDVDRLWAALRTCVRLDEPDPAQAWRDHIARLAQRAASLAERAFDGVRFRGPGTELFVALHPGAPWYTAEAYAPHGALFVPNMPTEEVLAVPDWRRVEGVVTSTRPLVLGGSLVEGLRLRFEGGIAVEVDADAGADVVREQLRLDPQAARLGEVALVDGDSRVGRTGLTYFSTLLDENATCHIAYGTAAGPVPGIEGDDDALIAAGVNRASVHTDFMIGGPAVDVFGVRTDGGETPLILEDAWQL